MNYYVSRYLVCALNRSSFYMCAWLLSLVNTTLGNNLAAVGRYHKNEEEEKG